MEAVPEWLLDVVRCPEDGGAVRAEADALRCERCDRRYMSDGGVLVLLPDRLRQIHGDERPDSRARHGSHGHDEHVRWIEDELEWWNEWHERDPLRPMSPTAGLRGRSRERNLMRHVRDRVPADGLVVEMGAGTSRTVAGLWPPAANGLRYVATDVSLPALQAGRRIIGPNAASVMCDAVGGWPFAEGVADAMLVLGVLHHLSDWRAALERACLTVRPGGLLVMHEVVEKPRVLARYRSGGANDAWVSPHEGDVPAAGIREILERHGEVLRWRGEESPLRFALYKYVVERRGHYQRLESSAALSAAFNAADQVFGRALGRVFPSLGFHEVTAIWQRAG